MSSQEDEKSLSPNLTGQGSGQLISDQEAWEKVGLPMNTPGIFFENPQFKILTQDGVVDNSEEQLKIKYRLIQIDVTAGIEFNSIANEMFSKQIDAIEEAKTRNTTDFFVIRVNAGRSAMGLLADFRVAVSAGKMFGGNYIIEGVYLQEISFTLKIALNMMGKDLKMSNSKIKIGVDENAILEFMSINVHNAIVDILEKKKKAKASSN